MPPLEKQKLLTFAKKANSPKPVAKLLAEKRASATQPPPGGPPAPAAALPEDDEEREVMLHEMVEEAAQEAEAGADLELEDAIAGYTSKDPQEVPDWVEDPDKWADVVEAVDLNGTAPDMYDEPLVVAAYLYKKIGGGVKGISSAEGADASEEASPDMSKPGSAAKALQARAAAKGGASEAAGAPPAGAAPPGKPAPGGKSVAPKPKPGEETGGEEEEAAPDVDAAAKEAQENPDPDLTAKLQDYDPERDGEPPSWATDAELWGKAKAAVEPKWTEYDAPYAVVAHLYKSMGGTTQ